MLQFPTYPNVQFKFFNHSIEVNLRKSIEDKVKENEDLTDLTALRILKEIQKESYILSLLTNPLITTPLSLMTTVVALSTSSEETLLMLTGKIAVGMLGGAMTGLSVQLTLNNHSISQAYLEQSKLAGKYIEQIENSPFNS